MLIYGKLRPGTWDAYEAAYKEVAEQSGQIPGLRARWLNRGSNKCLMGPTISTVASSQR